MPTPTRPAGSGDVSLKPTPKSFNDQPTIDGNRSGGGSGSKPNSRSSSPFFGIVINTPSFEKLLPKGVGGVSSSSTPQSGARGGSGSGAQGIGGCPGHRLPPPMPLTEQVGMGAAGSDGSALSSASRRQPPLEETKTEEYAAAEASGAGGLCGGTASLCEGYVEGAMTIGPSFIGGTVTGRDSPTKSVATNMEKSSDSRRHRLHGPFAMEEVDARPYALRHDEIVTALIDEALQNRSGGAAVGTKSADAATAAAVNQPESEWATEVKPMGDVAPNPVASGSGVKAKPRSPYRMARNFSGRSAGSMLRKRQRSGGVRESGGGLAPAPSAKLGPPPSGTRLRETPVTPPTSLCASVVDPAELLHPDCILQKEKGNGKWQSSRSDGDESAPSASGKEETLRKLRKKLSMLGDIEMGKFGRAAEMLRSDAVTFAIHGNDEGGDSGGVETRSILTLKMGFVSMSYGILLQWDCESKLVTLIVLRKMCRDDFLKGGEGTRRVALVEGGCDPGASSSRRRAAAPLEGRPPLVPIKKPEIVPTPLPTRLPCRDRVGEESPSHNLPEDRPENDNRGKHAWQRLSLPPPLASLPRLLSGAMYNHSRPQSFLAVSVLSVKKLHGGCSHCRSASRMGGIWSSLLSRHDRPTLTTSGLQERRHHIGKRRRRHTVRPYVRFVLGKHEHCTKITKFNSGSPTWTKRHNNSCLLPCPPEELRWFAGREDLIVEVRNNWKTPHGAATRQRHGGSAFYGGRLRDDVGPSSPLEDPILAAVTVPLSSVNIEDEGGDGDHQAHESDSEAGGGTFKRRTTRDGSSHTNITLPLRMSGCSHAPLGSISLKITMRIPSPDGSEVEVQGGSPLSSGTYPPLAKPDVLITGSGEEPRLSESIELDPLTRLMDTGSGEEPRLSESIELGPLTRLMDSWSLGGNTAHNEEEPVDSVAATAGQTKSTPRPSLNGNAPPTRNTNNTDNVGKGKRWRLRWSKQLDHQTKKWFTLRPSSNDGNAGGHAPPAATQMALTTNTNNPPSPVDNNKEKKGEFVGESNSGSNEGWFALLKFG